MKSFKNGDIIEAECCGDDSILYHDTIHEVKYIGREQTTGLHLCEMLAFGGDNRYSWNLHELHVPRGANLDKIYSVGDKVHVLLRNRRGKLSKNRYTMRLDGTKSKTGVWVKATILEVLPNRKYIVEHLEWNQPTGNRGRTTTIVSYKDVRDPFH